MTAFLSGILLGFLVGFVSGALVAGTSRICEYVKKRRERKKWKK